MLDLASSVLLSLVEEIFFDLFYPFNPKIIYTVVIFASTQANCRA